jgi:hypothetical protein
MRFKAVGNKSDLIGVVIRNNDTVQINAGVPVVLSLDGNGVDVVLPSTAASAEQTWSQRYGVCLRNVAVGYYGEAQVFGFSNDVTVLLTSRAATNASWSTTANISIGQYLTVDTVNNVFITMPTSIAIISASTQAAAAAFSLFDPFAVVAQTLSSIVMPVGTGTSSYAISAGSASSTANTLTALTASLQAFVRMM